MEFIIDVLILIKNVSIAFLTSWIRFFVSPRRKCVRGDIVLVTGAASGMGQAMVVEFAKLGAITVAWDINKKGLKDTVQMVEAVGGHCHSFICDVSDRNQVHHCAEEVRAQIGDVTILVNNAGVATGKRLLELTDEEVERTMGVNLMAQIWTTKEFLPSMMENNHGHIVNMGSSAGHVGLSHLVDYSASKFGVTGFTQTLTYELHFAGHDGIMTTLVSPSFVKTGMFAGCKMEYPLILPDLEQQPTVDRIMQAILTNQTELYLPRMVYIMVALKHVMPVAAMHEIIRFFRAHQFMDSFVGRKHMEDLLANTEE
ncbi:epidermal retinal dehydrogenase 2 [Plakobranchus ocellatus]|uniref:Short-chain dehydrogenase/reductase 3 n=1 Tax=Plakobranchus ocellatus TaxID=259542 RepID=A0AAV4DLJ3_9GAST|nr:epidermal retinal dehydrogenase 2 [Plakobranchus ocellatus]